MGKRLNQIFQSIETKKNEKKINDRSSMRIHHCDQTINYVILMLY